MRAAAASSSGLCLWDALWAVLVLVLAAPLLPSLQALALLLLEPELPVLPLSCVRDRAERGETSLVRDSRACAVDRLG